MEAGPKTLCFGDFGFNSREEETRLVVVVELEAAGLEDPDLARDVFLTVAVAPFFEAVDARFEVFLAIVRPVYQKWDLITNSST